MTPYINKNKDGSIEIIGEPDGLEALGYLLIAKSKLGKRLVANFYDGTNPVTHITSSDEIFKLLDDDSNEKQN